MNKFITVITIFIFISCGHPDYKEPHILIETRLGDIEVELYPEKAPITVAAFFKNIEEGMYKNGAFYRVLRSEELPSDFNTGLIQGGIWQTKQLPASAIRNISHENTKQTGLSHTDAVISMARKDTGTATTEFFICIGDQTSLDYGNSGNPDKQGFAAFGKVFKGMDIVRKIQNQASNGDQFIDKIEIRNIIKL